MTLYSCLSLIIIKNIYFFIHRFSNDNYTNKKKKSYNGLKIRSKLKFQIQSYFCIINNILISLLHKYGVNKE
jgi:hypothetical protein